jgi:hypothetical protein
MNFQPYTLLFREEKLRESDDFLESSNIDLSPDDLSKKRRDVVFVGFMDNFGIYARKKSMPLTETH